MSLTSKISNRFGFLWLPLSFLGNLFIYLKYREFTMIPWKIYLMNLELMKKGTNIKGDYVECGVWKGGMTAGASEIFGKNRRYYLFDSFEGLPPAQEIDGEGAIEWQKNTDSPNYYDNCTASENDARKAMEKSPAKDVQIVKGWFDQTLSQFPKERKIACLRLDADWYESTWICFEELYDSVAQGGLIIIDDYKSWDGCAKAVHDFLSSKKNADRLYQFNNSVSYILKH